MKNNALTYCRALLGFGVFTGLTMMGCGSTDPAGGGGKSEGSSSDATSTGGEGSSVSSAGSGEVTSGSAAAGGSGSGTACPGLGDPCSACAADQCSDTYCACQGDAGCVALIQCSRKCPLGDTACAQTCLSANPGAVSEALLLDDCAARSCAVACPGTAQLTSCQICLFKGCAPAMNTCLASAECAALLQCAQACVSGDLACAVGCADQHPGGVEDVEAVQSCSGGPCSAECQ